VAIIGRILLPLAPVLLLGACAHEQALSGAKSDPWESLNRSIYTFNNGVDSVSFKPVAKGYKYIIPGFARKGVTNFSRNLTTPRSAINNFLQGKPRRGFSDITRFLFNSVIGVGGLIDVASAGGLDVYDEDFGQTLAVWGVGDGPYVYLPLLGPYTLRDAIALPVDILSDPLIYYRVSSVRDKLYILRAIDLRARLFTAERLLEDSKDRYLTIRESYLQNREYQIYDGDPPEDEDFYDEMFDDVDEDQGEDQKED